MNNALEIVKQAVGLAPIRPTTLDLKLLTDGLGRTLPMSGGGAQLVGASPASWLGFGGDDVVANGYTNHGTAYSIINYILSTASPLPWAAYKIDKKDNRAAVVPTGPLADLVYRPNLRQSWAEFKTQCQGGYQVKGECFIRRVVPQAGSKRGKTAELWCLVGRVELLPLTGLGEFDAPTGYRHYDALTSRYTDYPAEEILHLKTWNPANPQRGLSPIQAGIDAITAAKSGLESRVKQYQNQGPPVFIFDKKANQPWTKEQSGQVRNWLASFFGNGRRAGEIPITGGDLGSISLGLSVKDMENLDAIPYDKDAVADLFRFPGQLLNGSKGTTFSNMAEAGAALYSRCVLPLETVLRDGLNRWIGPEYDDGQYLDFDISHIPELQPSKEKMATWLATAWWVSVKDKQKMMGLEVNWVGPDYLIPSTLMGSDELTAGVPDDAAGAGNAS